MEIYKSYDDEYEKTITFEGGDFIVVESDGLMGTDVCIISPVQVKLMYDWLIKEGKL